MLRPALSMAGFCGVASACFERRCFYLFNIFCLTSSCCIARKVAWLLLTAPFLLCDVLSRRRSASNAGSPSAAKLRADLASLGMLLPVFIPVLLAAGKTRRKLAKALGTGVVCDFKYVAQSALPSRVAKKLVGTK